MYINGATISTPGTFSSEGEAAAVYDSYAKAHGLEANSPERWQKWRKDHDGVDGFAMPMLFCTRKTPASTARLAKSKIWYRFCVKVVLACGGLVPLGAEMKM